MHTSNRGHVVTFYSFKGGVGRTMALANAAALYAQRGKKVLALDFDFEAPGLHRYFLTTNESSFTRYKPAGQQKGVLNFFYALRDLLREKWPDGQGFQEPEVRRLLPGIIEALLDSGEYIYEVRLNNPNIRNAPFSEVHLMAAARIDASYPDAVRGFDWQQFYDSYAELFPVLAQTLSDRYDYVLIDSRTGVTDIGSICTMMLPDKLVLVFTPNDQSLQGALEAGWQSVRARKDSGDPRPLPIFPLLSRVENSEEQEKRRWIEKAHHSFERMFREAYGLERCDLETYFNLVRIPHHSFYAYGEKIAVEEHATIETGSLAQAFARFVECLDCSSADEAQETLERAEKQARADERRATMRAFARGLSDEFSYQKLIHEQPDDPWPRLLYANFLMTRERTTEAVGILDEVIRRFAASPDVQHKESVAAAMLGKGICLGSMNRPNDALLTYDGLLRRFGESSEPPLREQVSKALVNKGWVLDNLNRPEDALATFDELLQRFGESSELSLRESIARALVGKGVVLNKLEQRENALATYDELLQRFSDSIELPLREQVARALLNKGVVLNRLGLREDALGTYDELLRRFGESSELPLREQVAKALVNKGWVLDDLNRPEDALATFDELLQRFGESSELSLRESAAMALLNKGVVLNKLEQRENALATYDELLQRFSDSIELPLREQVARALLNKGVVLNRLGLREDALGTYDELLRRFGESSELPLREQVAKALVNKGGVLSDLNRPEDALATFDELLQRFGESSELSLRESVARALLNKGMTLDTRNRHEDALATYDALLRRFSEFSELPLREQVARALLNKGVVLGKLNRHQDEIATYDELLRRFGRSSELPLSELVAKALFNKGFEFSDSNRHEEALAIYDEILQRFGETSKLPLREAVAKTLFNKGVVLSKINRHDEALAVYDELLLRFGDDSAPSLSRILGHALNAVGFNLLTQAKRAWQSGDVDTARSILKSAEVKIDAARARQPSDPFILGNAGYISFLLGRQAEARALLQKAFEIGGKNILRASLEDANIHSLPQDDAFRALIQSLLASATQVIPQEGLPE